jgi:hypothetical protein
MSTTYAVPKQYLNLNETATGLTERYKLDPSLVEWLEERSSYDFFFTAKYGFCLEIEDDLIALQFKLIFDL